jgi:acrylyl-CoA reductase (NADPH)
VACLARLGYEVTALTGKDLEHEYLRSLGAASILSRGTLQMGTRPLETALWAGAVDAAGGEILAWLTRTMKPGGAIASSGLTAGAELHTTVMPFILRGVKLLGIDSAMASRARREEAWRRLAGDLRPASLGNIAREIGLGDLATAFDALLKGKSKGRIVVRISDAPA